MICFMSVWNKIRLFKSKSIGIANKRYCAKPYILNHYKYRSLVSAGQINHSQTTGISLIQGDPKNFTSKPLC